MHNKTLFLPLSCQLRVALSALLLALACLLFTPLTVLACGGLFSADAYTEQSAERLIFAVNPGQVTLYEQIRYTGSPQNFAWVLPVPAVPDVGTVSASLFQDLDQQTAPRFYKYEAPSCSSGVAGAPAPASSAVNVYSGGTVGPYSYNVINSSKPQALVQWLTGHHYQIPAESQAEMQPYIAAHMFFLAMRLQGSAGVQDMTPVKITYATSQPAITIPLRMATPMNKEPLGVQVWIFGKSRYVPQNYQSVQPDYGQVNYDPASYPTAVNRVVSKAGGHGFVTEYAQPTGSLTASDPELTSLQQNYAYVTRLYTDISPAQINLDPSFIAQTGQPTVSSFHEVDAPANPQPVSCLPSPLIIGGILGGVLVIALGGILCVVIRKRRSI